MLPSEKPKSESQPEPQPEGSSSTSSENSSSDPSGGCSRQVLIALWEEKNKRSLLRVVKEYMVAGYRRDGWVVIARDPEGEEHNAV